MEKRVYVEFSCGNDVLLICPIGHIEPPVIGRVGDNIGMTNPASRFVRDFQGIVGSVVVEFRDPHPNDGRFGDEPWVAPEVPRPLRAIVRDSAAAVFGIVISDHAPALREAA